MSGGCGTEKTPTRQEVLNSEGSVVMKVTMQMFHGMFIQERIISTACFNRWNVNE